METKTMASTKTIENEMNDNEMKLKLKWGSKEVATMTASITMHGASDNTLQ